MSPDRCFTTSTPSSDPTRADEAYLERYEKDRKSVSVPGHKSWNQDGRAASNPPANNTSYHMALSLVLVAVMANDSPFRFFLVACGRPGPPLPPGPCFFWALGTQPPGRSLRSNSAV